MEINTFQQNRASQIGVSKWESHFLEITPNLPTPMHLDREEE
jgi:hypothetical protein